MPYPVKKFIQYCDNGDNYHRLAHDSAENYHFEYGVGDFGSLIPKEAKLKYNEGLGVAMSLFNSAGNTKIIDDVGSLGLLYLELKPNMVLNEIFVEPDEIVVDIYYGDSALIYSFYNPGNSNTISLNLSVTIDAHNAYSKIKAHSSDLEWRQYFIRQAMVKPGVQKIVASDPIIRDLMTVDQVADYIQVKKKTIQNWASSGRIPCCHIGGTVRYRKSEIDSVMESKKK